MIYLKKYILMKTLTLQLKEEIKLALIERDKVMRGVALAELSVTIYRSISVVYVGRFSGLDSPLPHGFLIIRKYQDLFEKVYLN